MRERATSVARPAAVRRKAVFSAALRAAQALSLDVVAGVVAGAALAAHVTGARMPPVWWVVLPILTWVVYSADRLLDARRVGPCPREFRHRFHRRHGPALYRHAMAALLIAAGCSLALLPAAVVAGGIALAAGAGAYLWLAQRARSRFPKEIVAALIYTGGIWFAPWLVAGLTRWSALAAALHFVAALLNLFVFAIFERETDALESHGSIVCRRGLGRTRRVVEWLTLVAVLAALFGCVAAPVPLRRAFVALLAVVAVPWSLERWAVRFGRRERYRLCGDLAFVLLAVPALLA